MITPTIFSFYNLKCSIKKRNYSLAGWAGAWSVQVMPRYWLNSSPQYFQTIIFCTNSPARWCRAMTTILTGCWARSSRIRTDFLMAVRIYRLGILLSTIVHPEPPSSIRTCCPVSCWSVFCYHFSPGWVKESFSKAGHLMVLINVCV